MIKVKVKGRVEEFTLITITSGSMGHPAKAYIYAKDLKIINVPAEDLETVVK